MKETLYHIPESVVEDTRGFRREVEKFISGEHSAVAFRGIRVPMGIYEQRENDTYMVRVRGAAGVFLAEQAKQIAQLSQQYGNALVHVTTRQDLQIHRVLVENTPDVLEKLLEVNLSSRGGGGNTVRNISACPLAGVCADEVFDVTPYALALTEYLICERANFNLPRKFKAAFSGCSSDCGRCSVADIGFFAHQRDGVDGFSVYAGGGMGAHSALAVIIEEWVPGTAIFEVAEAVKRLFDKYGDRANRSRARLRFVVQRFGPDEFRRLYNEELELVRAEGKTVPELRLSAPQAASVGAEPQALFEDSAYNSWVATHTSAQKQAALRSIRIALPLGDIEAAKLASVADLAIVYGDGRLHTSQDQDIYLHNIPAASLKPLYDALRLIDAALVETPSSKSIACAGASTCKLGLCLSRGLARAIDDELKDVASSFTIPVRISGCPNACGHHPIAPIGFYGGAVRVNSRLVPYYTLVAGGRLSEGDAELAQQIAKIPAHNVPRLIKDFTLAANINRIENESVDVLIKRWGIDYLRGIVAQYSDVPSYEQAPEFYRDFGSCSDFSLAGRGPGECGAGVTDVVGLDIDQAKRALHENDLYGAVLAAARALLVTRGLEPKKDREVFAAFSEHLIVPNWTTPAAQSVIDSALDFKLGDRESLDDLRGEIGILVDRVEQLFLSLDSNLNFRAEKLEPSKEVQTPVIEAYEVVNLLGVACPMNFVRAKIALEQIEDGQVLDILLDDGDPVRNVPTSFAEQGQEVISVTAEDGHFRVRVRKKA
ncbi:MAG: sulfurtransferase TusA family protein [Armatimonadota bacterium]